MQLWERIGEHIEQATGTPFAVCGRSGVGGGCINTATRVDDGRRRFFVKTGDASGEAMFEAEAEGLAELARSRTLRVPEPVCWGTAAGHAYLVMEDLDLGGRGDGSRLGERLAAMHRVTRGRFGWHRDNTIGSTPQPNAEEADWVAFWRERRLGYQLELAGRNGAPRGLLSDGERLLERFEGLFSDYRPAPSLLHGDLWAGNYGHTGEGEPVIFDPAVYFGDREADIAMTELFGGFGSRFYAAYNEAWALDAGYPVRKLLYNLYHVLNHFNMFGGGYGAQAQSMTGRLLAELRG